MTTAEQVEPSTAPRPSSPVPDNTLQSVQPSSIEAESAGVDFPPGLSELRAIRTRDHQFMFHAPTESSSPSRATQRSMSDPPYPTPPPDLSNIHFASSAPEPSIIREEDRVPPPVPEPHSQTNGNTDSAEQSDPYTQQDPQSRQSDTFPRTTLDLDRAGSAVSSVRITGSYDNDDVFQSTLQPVPATALTSSYPSLASSMVTAQPLTNDSELQVAAQSITIDPGLGFTPALEATSQPNGHIEVNGNGAQHTSDGYRPPPPEPEESSIMTMSEHLSRLFITKEWIDWSIEVSSPVSGYSPVGYHAHGMVIARSATLRQKMRQQLLSNRLDRIVIISPDRYIQPPAFEAALRYLYTEELITKSEVEQNRIVGGRDDRKLSQEYQLDCALSYWMAGAVLGLQAVAEQGKKLVGELMHWDIVEIALQQALALGERSIRVAAELSNTTPNTPDSSAAASATSPWKSIGSPSTDQYTSTLSAGLSPTYQYPAINEAMSRSIKRIIYDFMSARLDLSTLEVENPPTTILKSYLPETREYSNSSRYIPNPALSAIRFGALPLADEESLPEPTQPVKPRTAGHITSAVLLNLTFADLFDLCQTFKEHQIAVEQTGGSAQLFDWIQQVIAERESRRRKVLGSKTVSNQERLSKEQMWNVIGWEEHVEASEDGVGGWELRTTWKGFMMPGRQ